MSVVGTSTATCRMTLCSARSNEPEMACENFSQNIQASNTADGGSRQPCLDKVNRALAHEETSGLFKIYETPEPRSLTSMSILRTGSPLTSLPVSTAAGMPAGTPQRGTLLKEMRNALLCSAPFADEPYPPCYTTVVNGVCDIMRMFAEDWQSLPSDNLSYNHSSIPGRGQAAMYDRVREALRLNPSEENTPQENVFSNSPAPRFTVKSEIEDNEEVPPFVLNTPTHRKSERRVMIAPYPLNDNWSGRDPPPHVPRHEGQGEGRDDPRDKRDQVWGRPQGPLPPLPPGGGRGGYDPPSDDDDNDCRHHQERRNACTIQPPLNQQANPQAPQVYPPLQAVQMGQYNNPIAWGMTPGMSGYTDTLLDHYRQHIYKAVGRPSNPVGPEVKAMKITQPKAYKGQDSIDTFDEWVNQILHWFRIYKVTGPDRDVKSHIHGCLSGGPHGPMV